MRCLYIVTQDPISPNYFGGASAMYYDQLLALAELGHEVHLWHYATCERRAQFDRFIETEPNVFAEIKSRCHSTAFYTCNGDGGLLGRGLAKARSLLSPRIPLSRWSLYREFRRMLAKVKPEVIWAQHFDPATLAVQQQAVPVVYVHHDWLYRIKALRNHRAIRPEQKAIEERLVRAASAVVSGSRVECTEIADVGCPRVHHIPVSYEPVPLDLDRVNLSKPQVVHLGGMGTTANREGLLAFFERVWPTLERSGIDLNVIGDTSGATPSLQRHLKKVTCPGFVKDLAPVLRPFDIQIIPWEHATGQRTRIPLAFNHAQVVVTTRAASACYPEVRDRENARLVDKLEDMAPVITQLLADPGERVRLGRAARLTLEQCFTRKSLLPRYAKVLKDIELASVKRPEDLALNATSR